MDDPFLDSLAHAAFKHLIDLPPLDPLKSFQSQVFIPTFPETHMPIDPTKQYLFNDPSVPRFHGKPVTHLTRFPVTDNSLTWVGVCDNHMKFFSDSGCSLKEYDPPVSYRNLYGSVGVSWHFDTLAGAIANASKGEATGRFAIHASGRVRNIPLDLSVDPEA